MIQDVTMKMAGVTSDSQSCISWSCSFNLEFNDTK